MYIWAGDEQESHQESWGTSFLCTSAPFSSLGLLTNFRCLLIISVSSSICKGLSLPQGFRSVCCIPHFWLSQPLIPKIDPALVFNRGQCMDCSGLCPPYVQSGAFRVWKGSHKPKYAPRSLGGKWKPPSTAISIQMGSIQVTVYLSLTTPLLTLQSALGYWHWFIIPIFHRLILASDVKHAALMPEFSFVFGNPGPNFLVGWPSASFLAQGTESSLCFEECIQCIFIFVPWLVQDHSYKMPCFLYYCGGAQGGLPQEVPPWHVDYFELKTSKARKTQEEPLNFPLTA